MATKNLGSEAQKSGQRPRSANARHDEVRRQAEATKAETNARILAAFSAELTSYRTARELAAATGLADSTLGPRLHQLLADSQLVHDANGIHRPWPGRRWNWESARAAGEHQLAESLKREDLVTARRAATQRVNAAMLVLSEAIGTFGPQAPQSQGPAGDLSILHEVGKCLERCTSVQELELLVDDAFAALRCPIDEWTEATRQRDRDLALQREGAERLQAQAAFAAWAAVYLREVGPIFGLAPEWAGARLHDMYLQPGHHLPGLDGCGPSHDAETSAREGVNRAPYALCEGCGSPWTWTAKGWRPGYPDGRATLTDLRQAQQRADVSPRASSTQVALPRPKRASTRPQVMLAAPEENPLMRLVQGLGIRF